MSDDGSFVFDVTDSGIIGDMGVALARLRCGQMGHLFREQATHDRGIDAEIELADGSSATGQIIKVQIKCGASYFSRVTAEHFVVPIDQKHYEYWRRHSVPVIFVLANYETEECFWELISDASVESTGRNYVIRVPRGKAFDQTARRDIYAVATPIVPPQKFEIFDEQDTSTGAVRRLSYYLTLKPSANGWTKPEVEQLVRQVTAEARGSRYFRDELTQARWSGVPPGVVWVYVYFDEKHREIGEYVARAVWIDPCLDEELRPLGFSAPTDSAGFQIEWNHSFGKIIEAFEEHSVDKASYVAAVRSLVHESFDVTFKYWQYVALGTSRSEYHAQQLIADFTPLIELIEKLPIAPPSCSRVGKQIEVLKGELIAAKDLASRVVDAELENRDYNRVDDHTQLAFFKTHLVKHELDELN